MLCGNVTKNPQNNKKQRTKTRVTVIRNATYFFPQLEAVVRESIEGNARLLHQYNRVC